MNHFNKVKTTHNFVSLLFVLKHAYYMGSGGRNMNIHGLFLNTFTSRFEVGLITSYKTNDLDHL